MSSLKSKKGKQQQKTSASTILSQSKSTKLKSFLKVQTKPETISKKLFEEYNATTERQLQSEESKESEEESLSKQSSQPPLTDRQLEVREGEKISNEYYEQLPKSYILAMRGLQEVINQREKEISKLKVTIKEFTKKHEESEGEKERYAQNCNKLEEEISKMNVQIKYLRQNISKATENERQILREKIVMESEINQLKQTLKTTENKHLEQISQLQIKIHQKEEELKQKQEKYKKKEIEKYDEQSKRKQKLKKEEIINTQLIIKSRAKNTKNQSLTQLKKSKQSLSNQQQNYSSKLNIQEQPTALQNNNKHIRIIKEEKQHMASQATKDLIEALHRQQAMRIQDQEEINILKQQTIILSRKIAEQEERVLHDVNVSNLRPAKSEANFMKQRSYSLKKQPFEENYRQSFVKDSEVWQKTPHSAVKSRNSRPLNSLLYKEPYEAFPERRGLISQMRELMRTEKELVSLNYQMEMLQKSMAKGGKGSQQMQKVYVRLKRQIEKKQIQVKQHKRVIDGEGL